MYDISLPFMPTRVNRLKGGMYDIYINQEDTMAFIAAGPLGLVIMNITRKDVRPTIVGTVPTLWATQVILSLDEKYAYIVDQGFYLTIIDISDVTSP
jgi:hypothetical protein